MSSIHPMNRLRRHLHLPYGRRHHRHLHLQSGRRRPPSEQGSITPAMMVFAVAALAAAGLAVDGGRKLNGLSEARDLADNAARVGAQQVDVDAYRASGIPSLDAAAASGAATAYLSATGHAGSVAVNGDSITVTVRVDISHRLLPGSSSVTATETATAQASVVGN